MFISIQLIVINLWHCFDDYFNSVIQFPIDLEEYNRKEQLKMSGLGKVWSIIYGLASMYTVSFKLYTNENSVICTFSIQVITFLSKSNEETKSNRKLAKHLVDKWVIMSTFVPFFYL